MRAAVLFTALLLAAATRPAHAQGAAPAAVGGSIGASATILEPTTVRFDEALEVRARPRGEVEVAATVRVKAAARPLVRLETDGRSTPCAPTGAGSDPEAAALRCVLPGRAGDTQRAVTVVIAWNN
ncbi:MAG TPA: hypothetical protein VHG91_19730 [Longimicrobium sp.]|nr:hypothetical protein [Longimicrobium sp.]